MSLAFGAQVGHATLHLNHVPMIWPFVRHRFEGRPSHGVELSSIHRGWPSWRRSGSL